MNGLDSGDGAGAVPCDDCPVRRWPVFKPFAEEELGFVRGMWVARRTVAPEADIVRTGEEDGPLYTLWSGWAYRYKLSGGDGADRGIRHRQILNFLLPGDPIGLESALIGSIRHSVRALTEVTLCVHNPRMFSRIFKQCPDLSRALLETVLRDNRRADERLTMLGRKSAVERHAYFMLELHDRLAERGLVEDGDNGERCPFPLRRRHLSDVLGMSGTHVARSLAELQAAGLAEIVNDTLIIRDRARLSALSGYEPFNGWGRRVIL